MNAILKSMMVATTFIGVATFAAEAPQFNDVDKNKDGYISQDEAKSVPEIMKLFATVDADRDGKLSPAEYANAMKELQASVPGQR